MKLTDQQLAQRLLTRRKLNGKLAPLSLRQMTGYGIWAGLLIIAVALQTINSNNAVAAFLFGLVVAAVGRELVWYRAIKKTWRFSEKVTDWSKVEALANTPPADRP